MTLFISDLDGTLLNNHAALSEYAAASLRKMLGEGLCFTIATARTNDSASRILSVLPPLPLPMVLMNGAVILSAAEQRIVKKERIPPDTVRALLERVRAHNQQGFLYSLPEREIRVYHEPLTRPSLRTFYDYRARVYGKRFLETQNMAEHAAEDIVYFTTQDQIDNLVKLHAELKAIPGLDCVLYPDTYMENTCYLECFSVLASKKNALRWLRESYGFRRIVGFGDNLNDLTMLQACDEGYAVANAREEIKAVATGIIGSNQEEGVIKFLEKAWYEDGYRKERVK
ncbi:MAG: Cof-type HAD-IIB family hydrolase [Oscillospiraceae bacterium]|nr:Cof-type HAD-IIB family hydrolase [Oscillospiraceae bacterium]